ncbi:hypothetical protein RDI58_019786 [Solanum bulbocastanum]|uniref:Uncharacterized protein n=1 Tax=Solanum bulbocastanum TaxID=147425 RepID=A0AAN8Y6V9_SOLBU
MHSSMVDGSDSYVKPSIYHGVQGCLAREVRYIKGDISAFSLIPPSGGGILMIEVTSALLHLGKKTHDLALDPKLDHNKGQDERHIRKELVSCFGVHCLMSVVRIAATCALHLGDITPKASSYDPRPEREKYTGTFEHAIDMEEDRRARK